LAVFNFAYEIVQSQKRDKDINRSYLILSVFGSAPFQKVTKLVFIIHNQKTIANLYFLTPVDYSK
jgi:hypothetical protein